MKNKKIVIAFLGFSAFLFSCGGNSTTPSKSTATHVDRNYADDSGVKIGDQTWSSFNLDVSKFKNGDDIPYAKSVKEWAKACTDKKPAYCYFNDDPANGEKYGKLYNWYAVNDPRGLAPEGWHIPTNIDCEDLMFELGGKEIAGMKLKATSDWAVDKKNDNSSGFTALPGGTRDIDGVSDGIKYNSVWWTSIEEDDMQASCYGVYFNSDEALIYVVGSKGDGYAVRCLKETKKP